MIGYGDFITGLMSNRIKRLFMADTECTIPIK